MSHTSAKDRHLRATPIGLAQQGFTMLELLVSMLLLTIMLVGLTGLQVQTIRQATLARRAKQANKLAQSVLTRYKIMPVENIDNVLLNLWVDENNRDGSTMTQVDVDGVSDGPFRVQRFIENVNGGGKMVSVRVSWRNATQLADASAVTLTTMRF